MTSDKPPYVGYARPPEHTRFKKGTSGNPRGRPRKQEDLNTVLNRVLNRKLRIKDNDQKMPIREALIWKLRELALQGDRQAMAFVRRIIDDSGIADPDPLAELEKAKWEIIRALELMGVTFTNDEGEQNE